MNKLEELFGKNPEFEMFSWPISQCRFTPENYHDETGALRERFSVEFKAAPLPETY